MDHDGGGKLDFAEFLEHAYGIYKNYVEFETAGVDVPTAEEKFAELDVNKDKYVYPLELRKTSFSFKLRMIIINFLIK
jgi:hypothetical protein